MKGPHVAGQHADSAAGYCGSKTLSYSENIMIHLHIFNSRPVLTHMHACRDAHIKNTPHTAEKSQRGASEELSDVLKCWWALQKNNICTSSTARGGLLINMATNMKRTNPWWFPSFLSSSQWCITSLIHKEIHKCFSLPLSTTFSVTGGNKRGLSMGLKSLKYTH